MATLYHSEAAMQAAGVELNPGIVEEITSATWEEIRAGTARGVKSYLNQEEETEGVFDDQDANWRLMSLIAVTSKFAGVKMVGSNTENRLHGKRRSNSTIVLYDLATVQPVVLLDGTSISAMRTAAYAKRVIDLFLGFKSHLQIFVFGAGPIVRDTIIYLAHHTSSKIERIVVRSRRDSSSSDLVRELSPVTTFAIESATDNTLLAQADLVITATDARQPVFGPDEVAAGAVTLCLGHDEIPSQLIQDALENGIVACDDIVAVDHRKVQSLPLFFSRRGETLEQHGRSFGVQNLSQLLPLDHRNPAQPVLVTCVGLPMFDIAVAGYVFEKFLMPMAQQPAEGKSK